MNKNFIITGAFTGAFAVILGAFASHRLKDILEPALLQVFETGVKYQMYHALALLAIGIIYQQFPVKQLRLAGNLMIAGLVLFSGSLYVLCMVKHLQVNANWIGAITPLGGLCFIAGWLLLALAVARKS